jgi:hypothetical protein
MVLTDKQIEEVRQIYFQRYGKQISKEEASDQASKLLRLVMLIYQPMSLEEFDAIQARRIEEMPEIIEHIALHDNEGHI